jgi:hypothetical protein
MCTFHHFPGGGPPYTMKPLYLKLIQTACHTEQTSVSLSLFLSEFGGTFHVATKLDFIYFS